MKETVLIVHNFYQIPGGEDTVVANEKKMLEENGHKVVLYSRNNNELNVMGFFRKLFLPLTTVYNPRTAKDIKRIIKEENIDIVHVHNTLNLISPAIYYTALKMKIPVVQTIHNFRLLCPGATFYRDGHICEDCICKGLMCAIKHKCYRNSFLQTLICVIGTAIHRMTGIYGKINYICLTEFNREKLLNLKEIKEKQVYVKPNFVDDNDVFIPDEKRKEQFVFVGRLDKLKGIDLLLNTWKKLGDIAPKLIICGTGPMEKWCSSFIKQNNLNIEMLGFVPNQQTKKIVGESKALILPTQWYEGFPMTIVEAFSVGTPVICSNIGNSGSLIIDGINGYKIKINKPEGIMNAMNELMNKNMSSSTLELFNNHYTKNINYKILVNIYESVRI